MRLVSGLDVGVLRSVVDGCSKCVGVLEKIQSEWKLWCRDDWLATIFDELSLGGGDLSGEVVKLKELLSDFEDVFALSDAELG